LLLLNPSNPIKKPQLKETSEPLLLKYLKLLNTKIHGSVLNKNTSLCKVTEPHKNGHSDGQKEDSQPHKDNIIVLLEKEMPMEELSLKLI